MRKREACSESCGNKLITRTLTHHARSKRSEINSTYMYPWLSISISDADLANLCSGGKQIRHIHARILCGVEFDFSNIYHTKDTVTVVISRPWTLGSASERHFNSIFTTSIHSVLAHPHTPTHSDPPQPEEKLLWSHLLVLSLPDLSSSSPRCRMGTRGTTLVLLPTQLELIVPPLD